jgi:hypothetical protein
MNEGGNRRGLVFAALVVMLAAVGIYLTMGSGSGDEQQDPAEPAGVGRTVLGSQEQVSAAAPRPSATASDAPFDVYSYLPMTKQELAAAADYAQRFTAEYGTFRYDEDPAT